MTALAGGGWDARHVTAWLKRQGWQCTNGRDICPDCREDAEDASDG